MARDAAVVLSLALQHGTPIETIRHAVTRNGSGEAASILGGAIPTMQVQHSEFNLPRRARGDEKLADKIDSVTQADRLFFARASDRLRQHRIRSPVTPTCEQQALHLLQARFAGRCRLFTIVLINSRAIDCDLPSLGQPAEGNFDTLTSTIGEAAKWTFEGSGVVPFSRAQRRQGGRP